MRDTSQSSHLDLDSDVVPVEGAFRELHGRRLHGFALLMSLGDRGRAAVLTSDALAAAADQLPELRHPERAAAWLRSRVVAGARQRGDRDLEPSAAVVADLGADAAVLGGLAAVDPLRRAALIGADVEHLDLRDLAAVVGRSGASFERLLADARRRFIAAYLRISPEPDVSGPIVARVQEITRQAFG